MKKRICTDGAEDRRTETEDANKANVRMMKSHDTMTVLGSDT